MKRIVALDMLRGYALVCIMIDHMPASVLRGFTLTNYAIFDAAELFVLLSGFLVGMVWQNVERTDGMRAAQWRFARRAFEVWRALIIGALIMALLSAGLLAIGMHHTAIWLKYAEWVITQPGIYALQVASMWLQPNLLDVLATYVVLIAVTPVLMPALKSWPIIFAIGSVALWWFAPLLNPYIPNHDNRGFLFNPFGWQLLFFSGAAMALFRQDFMPVLLRYRHVVTALAVAIFLFSFATVMAQDMGAEGKELRHALAQIHGVIDKWRMDEARYVAIVASSWLVAVPLAGIMEWLASTRPGVALQEIGRGGLWSFVACVLLSVLADAFQLNPPQQEIWRRVMVDIWAIVALWCVAALWLKYGAPWQKGRKAKA